MFVHMFCIWGHLLEVRTVFGALQEHARNILQYVQLGGLVIGGATRVASFNCTHGIVISIQRFYQFSEPHIMLQIHVAILAQDLADCDEVRFRL